MDSPPTASEVRHGVSVSRRAPAPGSSAAVRAEARRIEAARAAEVAARIAAGVCVECGAIPIAEGSSFRACKACRDDMAARGGALLRELSGTTSPADVTPPGRS